MPKNRLACVLLGNRQIGVNAATIKIVIADGPVAIKPQSNNMDRERITWRSALDKKGTRFRITSKNSLYTVCVSAAGINGCGVNCVAGHNGHRRLRSGRKSVIELRGNEFARLSGRWGQCGQYGGDGQNRRLFDMPRTIKGRVRPS